MKKYITTAIVTMATIGGYSSFAQDEKTEDLLTVDLVHDMNSTYYTGVSLRPLQVGNFGQNTAFAFGGEIESNDLVPRLNLHLAYDKYFPFSFEDGLEDIKPSVFRATTSYSFFRKDKITDQMLVVDSKSSRTRTTLYTTAVKARLLISHEVNMGVVTNYNVSRDIFWETDETIIDPNGNTQTFPSAVRNNFVFSEVNFAIGYRYRTAANSVFKTNKYGKRSISKENAGFLNLLIPMSRNIEGVENIDAAVGRTLTTEERQMELDKIKQLPLGLDLGYRSGSRYSGWVFGLDVAILPGYYDTFDDGLLQLTRSTISLTYRFFHKKEGLKFSAD